MTTTFDEERSFLVDALSGLTEFFSEQYNNSTLHSARIKINHAQTLTRNLHYYIAGVARYTPGQGMAVGSANYITARELQSHLTLARRDGVLLLSYPKIRNAERMPDFDPKSDRYRIREGWLRFITETLKKRDPKIYEDHFKPYIDHGTHTYFVEQVGEFLSDKTYDFKVVDGQDIVSIYREEHFGSCMHNPKHNSGASKVSWYGAMGAATVQMLTARDPSTGKLAARALLWHARNLQNGEAATVLDRIYPGGSQIAPHIREMIRWAKENGVTDWKDYQAVDSDFVSGNVYTVTVPANDGYPYVDSFRYAKYVADSTNPETVLKVKLVTSYEYDHDATLDDIDGSDALEGGSGDDDDDDYYDDYCDRCGDGTNQGVDTVYSGPNSHSRWCSDCIQEHALCVDGEESGWACGEYVSDSIAVTDHEGAVILKINAVNIYGDAYSWAHKDRVVTTYDGVVIPTEDSVELYDDKYAQDDAILAVYDGQLHTPGQLVARLGEEAAWRHAVAEDSIEFLTQIKPLIDESIREANAEVVG